MSNAEALLADSHWLPHRLNRDSDRLIMRRLDRAAHEQATFLEEYYFDETMPEAELAMDDVRHWAAERARPEMRLLVHPSMALSTLTTRLFDQPGSAMAYKEPILLSQLAKLERAGLLSDGDSDALMALLFRPFDGDPVLIKPGSPANRLATRWLVRGSPCRMLIQTAPVRDFLRSVAKRGTQGRTIYRRLYALVRSDFPLPGLYDDDDAERFELTDLQCAALAWFHQMIFFGRLAEGFPAAVRTLDSVDYLAAPEASATAIAGFLGLPIDVRKQAEAGVFARHSKTSTRAFDPAERDREQADIEAVHGRELDEVTEWFETLLDADGAVRIDLPQRLLAVAA